ncbi:MAG: enoyl-CoA hydratase [Thiotrichales bacterium]|jgi:2-(1,2-epoxy-1,2-dihydrophenyl)acetyl-CoA isomerase|nr:enoyl-CoA hydratase [Thiotrichales bacterium]|tara:strand:- start:248 stop:1045 length:798 start_codon:yes stop_codon:yes gene_type:complete
MPDLLVNIEDHIATLTLNRPEARNALSEEMRTLLKESLCEIESDDNVRCVVIRGAGEHFMAGGDVKSMSTMLDEEPEKIRVAFRKRIYEGINSIMLSIRRMPKPVIASVSGAAAGAGVSMAMSCDLVIADSDSFFTLAYCHIGTTPDGGASFQLPRSVGVKRAMEIALLGDRYDAETARSLGMINFVSKPGELANETQKLANRLSLGPTHVYANTKKLLYQSIGNDFETQLQMEADFFADCASRKDFKEGVTAFVEKRRTNFKGN